MFRTTQRLIATTAKFRSGQAFKAITPPLSSWTARFSEGKHPDNGDNAKNENWDNLMSFLEEEKTKKPKKDGQLTGLAAAIEKTIKYSKQASGEPEAFEDLDASDIEEPNPTKQAHNILAVIEDELSGLTPSQLSQEDQEFEFQKHSKLEKALLHVLHYDDFRERLPLWQLYPKSVKKWLTYVATPLGYYGPIGKWQPVDAFAENTIKPEPIAEKRLQPRKDLPADLVGKYRMGVQPNEAEITQFRKREVRKRFRREPADTGSSEVQIAILTVQIEALSDHLIKHQKDKHSRRGLQIATSKRKALMLYLRRKNPAKYYEVISKMKIPDLPVGAGPSFLESKARLEQRLRESQRRAQLAKEKAAKAEKTTSKKTKQSR